MSLVVDLPSLRETCKQLLRAMDAALAKTPLSRHEVSSLIREAVAALLLLRWFDQAEAEQEAMAVFEDRAYQPLLPEQLHWHHWHAFEQPAALADLVHKLADLLERNEADAAKAGAPWLRRLAAPLRRLLKVDPVYLRDLLQWIAALPFETPSDRRGLLEMFDLVLAETSEVYDGQHQTPANIARLVAALAQPQQGERVYDPCFGVGNFLIAAWQQSERTWQQARRPGPLLEVAGIEINEATFLIGLTRMLLAGIDHPQLELGNSLERGQPNRPSREGFDLVLANPPIGAKVNRDGWGLQHFAFPTADSVGLFIQHVLAQLKPQGRAVIAVPEGFLFRGGVERELRRHLLEHGQVEAVVGLPAGSFAPYASVKGALLLLRRKGGADRVRMVDAGPLFDVRSDGKGQGNAPVIRTEVAQQLAVDLMRSELRRPVKGVEDDTPDRGLISRFLWEVPVSDLASADWDLSPRRRERGGLVDLLASLQDALGQQLELAQLKDVVQVTAGRAIRSADLLEAPPSQSERGPTLPYLRIKDLQKGKVARASSWLRPELASVEQRWALMPGDVLLSKSGTIGKAAIVRNGTAGAIAGNGLYVLRADPQKLDAGFLHAYLSSPTCQSWLTARARGAVIQHLNRGVLDELPVPLPPLHLQGRAAAQFRDHGTDVLTFLLQLSPGGEAERIAAWLAAFSEKLPVFAAGLDATPPLSAMEGLVAMSASPRRWLEQEDVEGATARWLRPLVDTLQPLAGAAEIPLGPGLLSVLQDADRAVVRVVDQASGHLPVEGQARSVAERLLNWIRALMQDLVETTELRITEVPQVLPAGSDVELTVMVTNAGVLPLREVRLSTDPDWGSTSTNYLAERTGLPLTLRGETPKHGNRLALWVEWQGRTLAGQMVGGTMELAVGVGTPTPVTGPEQALGGNPYVTGSPLEPQHGHAVFFGRDGLIAQISSQIVTHGNVVLLEGNRRAGKTSILKHLEGSTAIPGWLAVYASLQAAEGAAQAVGVPTAEVFRLIAFELSRGIASLKVDTPLPDGSSVHREALLGESKLAKLQESGRIRKACRSGISEQSPFADFRDYLGIILEIADSQGMGIVLMLDEFDKLQEGIDNHVTSPQVPENIRFLIQSHPRFSAILTGSRRLKRLREEYWSALYGLGTSIHVTALDADSARRVVTEPVRGRLTLSDEAVRQIIRLTAMQPYLIQCLCNRVFDFAIQAKTRSVTVAAVERAATELVRDNEHFASLWDYAARRPPPGGCRRQLILLQCAMASKRNTHISFGTLREQLAQLGVEAEEADLDVDLAYLRELDLVELSGDIGDGQYGLAIPLMAQWIAQQQDADVVTSRARAEAEDDHE